jgi:MFS family permease
MIHRQTLRELTLMASSMITIIGTTVIAASLPHMSEAYASLPNGRFLVNVSLTLPALSAALFGPVMGATIDRWGRKRPFLVAMILYGLAGTAGSYLPSLYAILASRFVLGIAVAGITTCATALIADYADQRKLGGLMGRQSLFMAAGNVVFVSLAGVLADHHWRYPFLICAVSFVILPGVVFLIAEPRAPRGSRAERAAAQSEALPIARTVLVYAIGFTNMVVYFMVPVYLPFHLRSFSSYNSARVGGLLALVGLSWGLSSSLYHRYRRHLTFEKITMIAFAIMGIAHLLMASASGYPMVILALVMIGFGLGAIVPNLNAWLLSFVPPSMKGRAIGGLVFFVFLGQFFSPIITRPLSDAAGIASSYLVSGSLLLLIALGHIALAPRRHEGKAPISGT